jgi:predicted transcriptional regulator
MSTKGKKAARISVSLDDQDYRELSLIAQKSDVSVAWVIRRAISEFLVQQRGAGAGQLPLDLKPPTAGR